MSYQKISVDLHIHSVLSPCGDIMMTPGNLVGMAKINGLDAIALTDHNAMQNIPAAIKIGEAYDIVVIPGMELETAEEIHVVCLFPDTESLSAFQDVVVESYGPKIPANRPDIFGKQLIYNEEDEECGELERMLLIPSGITIDDIFGIVEGLGGIAFPAHVDRDSYSVLTTLGALPYGYKNGFVEISCECDKENLVKMYPELEKYKLLPSSDAHYIDKIQEAGGAELLVEELSVKGVIEALKNSRII
ncbi:MAG: PHP domain-containing protein [Clostridia bacterium]|nr:PHP domain-containing protein [Clostridia bacterium]